MESLDSILNNWEKIAIIVAPILTWIFKTRVYDKLEVKQKEVSVRKDGANVVEQNLELYQEIIDDMDKRHKEQLDRKDREIAKILNKQRKPVTELKYHRLFQVIESVGKRVEGIEFITHKKPDKVKTLLMNILIQEKLVAVRVVFTDLLDDKELRVCSGNALRTKVATALRGLVGNYNDNARDLFVDVGVSEVDAGYLIDTYEEYRLELVNGFLESLEDISTNDDYSTNYDKLNAIYDLVALSIYLIPKDVKEALNSVNGRFVKYESLLN